MGDSEPVIEQVRAAFGANAFPGDAFLQGSFDGCEPYDEVSQFHGRSDWQALDAEFLDARYCALSFFSEGAFRFFIPAYLVADLRGQLQTADPVFHLTHGLVAFTTEHAVGGRAFARQAGPRVLVNPRRYGAMTWADHARHRLSVFTREEARAVVAYLRARRAAAPTDFERDQVDQALAAYWLARADAAPSAAEVAQHQTQEAEYAAALQAQLAQAPPAPANPPPDGGP